MANIHIPVKISMLIDIKLEKRSEKWEFCVEKESKFSGREMNIRKVLEVSLRTLRQQTSYK